MTEVKQRAEVEDEDTQCMYVPTTDFRQIFFEDWIQRPLSQWERNQYEHKTWVNKYTMDWSYKTKEKEEEEEEEEDADEETKDNGHYPSGRGNYMDVDKQYLFTRRGHFSR